MPLSVLDVQFDLAVAAALVLGPHAVRARGQLHPAGAGHLGVDHEAQHDLEVALVGLQRDVAKRVAREPALDDA